MEQAGGSENSIPMSEAQRVLPHFRGRYPPHAHITTLDNSDITCAMTATLLTYGWDIRKNLSNEVSKAISAKYKED